MLNREVEGSVFICSFAAHDVENASDTTDHLRGLSMELRIEILQMSLLRLSILF